MAREEYKGVALPWGPTIASFIEPKSDEYVLKSSVLFIIMTGLGERVMLPEFGSRIREVVFDPNDEGSISLLRQYIEEAVRIWDDRVEIVSFTAEQDVEHHRIDCVLVFKDRRAPTNQVTQTVEFSL
jgi:phage baseplate assembly protein W